MIKILLALAETIVEGGTIRSPLEFYQELANQLSSGLVFQKTEPGPLTRIYQLQSAGVKRLSAAVALCPEGIQSRDGDPIKILFLISVPKDTDPLNLNLPDQVLRVLGPASHRETLLTCKTPATAGATLFRLESEISPARSGPGRG